MADVTLNPYTQELSEPIKAGLASGDLTQEPGSVKTKASKTKLVDGKPVTEEFQATKSYVKLVAKTPNGALILAGGKPEDLLSMISAQFDAGTRQNVRNAILAEVAGPDAAIEKLVKQLMATTGKPESVVRAEVLAIPSLAALLAAQ